MSSSVPLDFKHTFVQGASKRTLLLLHGTGGNENDLLPLGRALDPEASLLSPRGKVLENGMPRFFRRLAEGVFDLEDLVVRTEELAKFVGLASAKYGFDPGYLFAVGYSNGANIAGALLLLSPGLLSGAALLRPMVPIVPETLPQLNGVTVLIIAGDHDPIVPVDEARKLATLLRNAGAEVAISVENAGHGLTQETVQITRRWLTGPGVD
jgi:phospholipase/carboxylesterase